MSLSIFSSKGISALRDLPPQTRLKIGVLISLLALMVPLTKWILIQFVKDENPRTAAISSINDQTRALIVGCSHVSTNINPSLMTYRAMNLSIPNANYADVLGMLSAIWHKSKKIDFLVIEFSSAMLLRGSGGSIRHMAQRDFGYSERISWTDLIINPGESIHLLLYFIYNWRLVPRHMFDKDLNSTRKKTLQSPGYEAFPLKFDRVKSKLSAIKRYQAIFDSTDAHSIEHNTSGLKKALSMAQERGIKTLFIKMPEHEQLRYMRPAVWVDHNLMKLREGNPLIDLGEWHHKDDDFFGDFDHLSPRGAQSFSGEIDRLLHIHSGQPKPASS